MTKYCFEKLTLAKKVVAYKVKAYTGYHCFFFLFKTTKKNFKAIFFYIRQLLKLDVCITTNTYKEINKHHAVQLV